MDGIVIATDCNQEWLLPWWWDHYIRENQYPVAVFDLGMTKEALSWCKERAKVISLPLRSSFKKESVPPSLRKLWDRHLAPHFWQAREQWMQKPFIVQSSPFDRSIWLDLDCMVRGSLEPLFHYLNFGIELAIAKVSERSEKALKKAGLLSPNESSFNSGVFAYVKDALFLDLWVKKVQAEHFQFIGDQDVLSKILTNSLVNYIELPQIYNWAVCEGLNEQALILHFVGADGKSVIQKTYTQRI